MAQRVVSPFQVDVAQEIKVKMLGLHQLFDGIGCRAINVFAPNFVDDGFGVADEVIGVFGCSRVDGTLLALGYGDDVVDVVMIISVRKIGSRIFRNEIARKMLRELSRQGGFPRLFGTDDGDFKHVSVPPFSTR